MNLEHLLENARPLSYQADGLSWHVPDGDGAGCVVRLVRLSDRFTGAHGRLLDEIAAGAQVAEVACVPRWRHFRYLRESERRELALAEGHWLVAVRDWVPGTTLHEVEGLVGTDGMSVALQLAYTVRELHEHGLVHGDLQPANVVYDDDAKMWLIDVPLVATTSDDRGHVAGSAPLMAPERWQGAAATVESDVYALGAFVCWLASREWPLQADSLAQWAQAHRHRRPTLPDRIDGRLAGVVTRMLAKDAELRPSLQSLIDALIDAGGQIDLPAVRPLPGEVDATATAALEALEEKPTVVVVDRDRKLFARPALRQVARRLELAGERVIFVRGAQLDAPLDETRAPDSDADPWNLAYALVEKVCQDPDVHEHLAREAGRGDQLHTFEVFAEALIDALPETGLTVVWEDFEAAGPDVRRWWSFVLEQPARLRCVLGASPVEADAAVALLTPAEDPSVWGSWRAKTLRTEVRDIAGGHWKGLVDRAQGRPDRLVQLINQRVGAPFEPDTVSIRDSGVFRAPLSAGRWQERYDSLVERGAFGQAAECCAEVYAQRVVLNDEQAREVLEAWTDVILRGVASPRHVHELERALVAEIDAMAEMGASGLVCDATVAFARLAHNQGRHADGLARLSSVADTLSAEDAPLELARCRLWQAQLSLSSGQFDDAKAFANKGLELAAKLPADGTEALRAHLELVLHAAGAIYGDRDAIAALEDLHERLEHPGVAPVLRARCHAYRALGLTRHDRLDEATDAYRRALEIIEGAGLDAELPIYLLNVGTAYHRQGRLGIAREYYARGVRLAQPSTRPSTRALLYANQANIEQALGRLPEARASLDDAWEVALEHELGSVLVLCYSMQGEIHLAEGDLAQALASYEAALGDASLPVSAFSRAELLLHSAEACLLKEDLVRSHEFIDEARSLIEGHELTGLEGYHGMLRARLQWEEGGSVGVMAGIELFRRSLLQTAEAGNHKLVLRQSPYLWRLLEREGLGDLMEEVAEIALKSKNAIAMGLTRELRDDFFAQLPSLEVDDVDVADDPPASPASSSRPARPEQDARGIWQSRRRARHAPESDAILERFYRMLSLNEVILHSDDLARLTPKALDIALSLSGAERGFILLRDPDRARVGDFRIVASRDAHAQPIPEPHLEVSLTVAEEAASTGQTVVTVNAQDDTRFEQALSVVDLSLTSVLCVPIRDSGGLLGALYLDHRFQPGIFEGEVTRMMEAFGHQLALAITNVRRLDELERERRELAQAKERLDELLAEREVMLGELRDRVGELTEEVERQRLTSPTRSTFEHIAFASRAMEDVLVQVERVAKSDIPVVVHGESGVGKELVAEALHAASPRSNGPFVAFNCGAVSESLMESEMFGHVKGAFTGAQSDREGFFHAANGGTIFLDEVGEMPASMQVKLLRVLQERKVRRVGATEAEPVDVRVVCATHRSLEEMVEEGSFREDLYYRLAAFVVEVPPLRDRREDIPLIARKLLDRIGESSGESYRLVPEAARLLSQAHWKGNVRELENTLRAACALADGCELGERDVAPLLRIREADDGREGRRPSRTTSRTSKLGRKPKAGRAEVVEALRRAGGDKERAAEALGVSVRTLYRYQKKYDIE
ncbi:GAF domain-containing protein [Persicimonas caeni]|uniref:GAF domain-containing protein n=1 Tax=Persicimonas caeni TaxID=2292766 RepID=A0A4Y6PQF0_PERCE|nr:sigma 54-interacting transcriptional regulator [Persicimonas caeni]QDG50470.1 GAF domain-containing protein [Persicimonas caeni]QED31691.1 protein kinase [Persicimonas caeni]